MAPTNSVFPLAQPTAGLLTSPKCCGWKGSQRAQKIRTISSSCPTPTPENRSQLHCSVVWNQQTLLSRQKGSRGQGPLHSADTPPCHWIIMVLRRPQGGAAGKSRLPSSCPSNKLHPTSLAGAHPVSAFHSRPGQPNWQVSRGYRG
jgi:hypothetical protein